MSVFSELPTSAWVASNAHAFAIRDRFPVSPGHTLVITKRPDVRDWFEATDDERRAIFELVDEVKRALDRETPRPDGYNLGINVGAAAGQTVMHLHVHVIPRYASDVDDPRGGVRHVIPEKGYYSFAEAAGTASRVEDSPKSAKKAPLEKIRTASPLATGGEADPLARQILPLFALADDVAIVAAFVQTSGLERIEPELDAALARGATIRILTGDYLEITQVEALKRLLHLQRTATLEDDDELTRPRDGDWALLRRARSAQAAEPENRLALIELPGEEATQRYQPKKRVREGHRWLPASNDPDYPPIEATAEMKPIAKLEEVICPEDLAPSPGALLEADEAAGEFGLDTLEPKTGRYDGHIFLFLEDKGALERPTEPVPNPGLSRVREKPPTCLRGMPMPGTTSAWETSRRR